METKRRNIDGYDVEISLLPASRAIELMNPVGKMIAPIFGSLSELMKDAKIDKAKFAQTISDVLLQVFQTTSGEQLAYMINELLTPCTVSVQGGKRAPFNSIMNTEFRGKTKTVLKIFAFAIEENYADFISDLRGSVPAQDAEASPNA